jgi:hypothetical protein
MVSWPQKKVRSTAVQILFILGLTLFIGVLVELIQAGFERTPDTGDLFRNLIGALCGIAFSGRAGRIFSARVRRGFQVFVIAMVALQIYPVAVALIDEHRARQQFPVLSDFESPFEIQRWRGGADFAIDHTVRYTGRASLRVALNTETYSGISLGYFPQNWHGFSQFQVRAFNPAEKSLSITCRIHDAIHTNGAQRYSDRFNRTFTLLRGWNTITIPMEEIRSAPATRKMDLGHMRVIGIFATRLPQSRLIYIDDVKLLLNRF